MSQEHLNDKQIQDYLDNRMPDKSSFVANHLRQCTQCRHELALYRELYMTLEKDPLPKLPADFADRVIARLPVAGGSRWDKLESGFIAGIILVTLAVSTYFVNPLPLLIETGKSLWHSLPFLNSDVLTKLNGNLSLLLIAVLIFLLVEVFDKKLIKHKF
jgi:hypothetical protein